MPWTTALERTVWKGSAFQFPCESVAQETPGGHGGFSASICIEQFSGGVVCSVDDPDPPPQPVNSPMPAQIAHHQTRRKGLKDVMITPKRSSCRCPCLYILNTDSRS